MVAEVHQNTLLAPAANLKAQKYGISNFKPTENEPEFQQAVDEIEHSLGPVFAKHPELRKAFEIAQVPERIIQFRVTWERDDGSIQVNRGYRVQFNSALGPYKGGLRFHPTVNLSILKFLGFEQIFKNALTGLAMGGGKGGADFDPKDKSDNEIRRFCESFMRELSRHIGDDTDVPAGDIGVGGREIGYLFGAYKRYRNQWHGVLTGKGMDWGGSNIRPEATGYGLIYFVEHMISELEGKQLDDTFKGKVVAISGSGNVAQYAALKVIELGGTVVSLSDSRGTLTSGPSGFSKDLVFEIQELKLNHGYLESIASKLANQGFTYHPGSRPWTLFDKLDVALPCATQNEVSESEAKALVKAGVKYVAEGSNMGSTLEAIRVFEDARANNPRGQGLWYAPGKAANAGGVAVSGLEMAQNSIRYQWAHEEVDAKLKEIMKGAYTVSFETSKRFQDDSRQVPSLVSGANLGSFLKIADAMKEHGDWY